MKNWKSLSKITAPDLLKAVNIALIHPIAKELKHSSWKIEYAEQNIKLTAIGKPYVVWMHFEGEPVFTGINEFTGRPIMMNDNNAENYLHKIGYQLPYEM